MKIHIPALGTVLKLTSPWSYMLYREDRNRSVWHLLNLPWNHRETSIWRQPDISNEDLARYNVIAFPRKGYKPGVSWGSAFTYAYHHILPIGAELKIDRIYIKKNNPEFDSVTFTIGKGTIPGYTHGKARFWAKLDDVNTIEADIL